MPFRLAHSDIDRPLSIPSGSRVLRSIPGKELDQFYGYRKVDGLWSQTAYCAYPDQKAYEAIEPNPKMNPLNEGASVEDPGAA